MMTDPIADMLTRLRNANTPFHDEVLMPSSKLKEALARILEREGYIAGWDVSKDESRPGNRLKIELKYTPDRKRTISGLKRVSKPGLRVYMGSHDVPRGARRHGHRHPLDQPGTHDRPRGAPVSRGRRGPVPGLVTEHPMSRIGKQPITIPSGVDVTLDGAHVTVKGPKGTLVRRARRHHHRS